MISTSFSRAAFVLNDGSCTRAALFYFCVVRVGGCLIAFVCVAVCPSHIIRRKHPNPARVSGVNFAGGPSKGKLTANSIGCSSGTIRRRSLNACSHNFSIVSQSFTATAQIAQTKVQLNAVLGLREGQRKACAQVGSRTNAILDRILDFHVVLPVAQRACADR
eukprot:597585-Rhodomonas_salina.1